MIWLIRNWQLALLMAVAFLAAALGIRSSWLSTRLERVQARAKAQQEDFENAQDIRRRVSDNRDERVRSLDDAGYRD